jgi:uncharacterized membrane protein YccC
MTMLLTSGQWLLCLQCALSMMAAYFVTHGSDPTNGIYAILGAGLVTAPSFGEGLGASKERLIATLLGAVASLPAMWIPDRALALAATAAIVTPAGFLLGGISIARIAVTVAAVSVVLHVDSAVHYGLFRFTNTLAGVAVALAISILFWPLTKRLDFTTTVHSLLKASTTLADQLASQLPTPAAFAAQRALFAALSNLPKSFLHLRRDPLLRRVREEMRREALLAVEIGVALLSMSLVMERRGTTLADGETARIQPLCRHVADRLRELQRHYPKGAAASTEAACAPPWAPDDAAPAPHVALMSEELLAINRWLDDLHALLRQHGVNRA